MANPTPPTTTRTVKVSVISDIVCPWCFIATKEILIAIERLQLRDDSPVKFELEHKPYLLNPSWADDETHNMAEHFNKNLGEKRWAQVQKVLKKRGEDVGLNFRGDGFMCSTLRAHRLLLLAWRKGGSKVQTKLLNALYQGCLEEGENVGELGYLSAKAEEVGIMPKAEALEFLQSDELKVDVQRMVSCAQRNEVKGVPFTIIEGRWAISGGQSSDVFFEIFKKLVEGEDPDIDAKTHQAAACK